MYLMTLLAFASKNQIDPTKIYYAENKLIILGNAIAVDL